MALLGFDIFLSYPQASLQTPDSSRPSQHQGRTTFPRSLGGQPSRPAPHGAVSTTFPRQLCGSLVQKTTFPSVLSRWNCNLWRLGAVTRLRLPEAFAADKGNYASPRPLWLCDRKRQASRVSLRAELSNYGVPSVVADEVRGVAGRVPSPRESPLLRTPISGLPPTCPFLLVALDACGPHGETAA